MRRSVNFASLVNGEYSTCPAADITPYALDVISACDGHHIVQMNLLQRDVDLEAQVRLGEEISHPIHGETARIEDVAVKMHGGRIGSLFRMDVPNIFREKIQMAEMQRFRLRIIDVRDVGIVQPEYIDLERIDRQHRVLPSSVLHGLIVLRLFFGLRPRHAQHRTIDAVITDKMSVEYGPPMNTGMREGNLCDRRIGMSF